MIPTYQHTIDTVNSMTPGPEVKNPVAEQEAQLAKLPLWLRTCVECLMQPWSDSDASTAKADAMLDAAELLLKHAVQAATADMFYGRGLATEVINKIAAGRPVGWKIRVRAARLLVESGL